jgi:hypothetical protein
MFLDKLIKFIGFVLVSFVAMRLWKIIYLSEQPKGLDVLIHIPLLIIFISVASSLSLLACYLLYSIFIKEHNDL